MATATAPTGTMLPGATDAGALATRPGSAERNAMTTVGSDTAIRLGDDGMPLADYSGPFGPIKQILDQPAVKKSLPLMVIARVMHAMRFATTSL